MIRQIRRNIFFVPGEDKARFPYCNGLYLKGREMRVLIDAGMGPGAIGACLERGVDALVLSHCHYDHRSTIRLLQGIPVWCHEAEVPYVVDRDRYLEGMGLARSGIDMAEIQRGRPFPDIRVGRTLRAGETIDLGGLCVEAVHAPGHTPGHLAFRVDGDALLFTSDVALTPFGPFYGNDFADIDDFVATIRKLRDLRAGQVFTSHAGPFDDRIPERFDAYEEAIHRKDRVLLAALETPGRIEDLSGRNLFYPFYYEPVRLIQWFERVEIEKHLRRLERAGSIRKEGSVLIRV